MTEDGLTFHQNQSINLNYINSFKCLFFLFLYHLACSLFLVTHTHTHTHAHICIFFTIKTCESTCDIRPSSAGNQGDNTVSVAQGGTATPGATKQLLPPDRVFKRNIYVYIYIYMYIFTNPSAWAGYDTRSIFMRSLTGLNSEFSFS